MYCDEYFSACVFVCVFVCQRGYLRNHTHDLYQFLFMHGSVPSGVGALRYVLPVLWMTSYLFSIMGRMAGMNFFVTKDRFRLNLLIYRKIGENSIFYY